MIVRCDGGLVWLAACSVLTPPSAQDWPSKPVRIVTGFAAGGIGDLGARLLAEHITRTTGQQAVVENRTGAAGTLGMDAVAKAAPDGTTLGLALNGNLVINPFIQKSMPFDALKDLVPVAMIGDAPQMIALSTEVPAKTLQGIPGAGEGQARHLQLRLGRPGLAAASFDGRVRAHGRHRSRARAVSRQCAGHDRPDRRPHPARVELDRPVPPGDGCRENPAAAHRDEKPAGLSAGPADLGRGRAAGLPHERVDRRRRAGRHARADARPHPRADRRTC